MSDLGTARGSIVIDTSDVKRAAAEVKRGSQQMTQALNAIGIGVGLVAVKRLGEMAYELAENAAQAKVTREAFDALAASFDQNADDMLSAMRTASKGMISDANLVLSANRAMLLGVADSAEKMNTLLDISRVRGQAMGLTLTKAFDDLVTGLGRVQPKILDNLGIHGGQEALDAYAKSVGTTADKLSDAQSQAILFNFILKDSKSLLDAAAKSADTAATKFQQFGAKLENTKKQLGDFLLEASATDSLDTFSTAIDNSITQLNQIGDAFAKAQRNAENFWNSLDQATPIPGWFKEAAGWLKAYQDMQQHYGFDLGLNFDDPYQPTLRHKTGIGSNIRERPTGAGGHSPVPIPASVIDTKALLAAQVDYNKKLGDINRNANRDIQKATEDAGRQRAETIRSYELGIARDEEDFLRSRARQQRDYEMSIVQIMRDAQTRDAKIQADLGEQIGDAQKDSNKRLAEQEKDFQKQRQRAQRDFSDDLLDAAGDLDAKRVYELQRDNAKQQKDAQEDHDEAIKKERESLAERIEEAQKAAQKQLDEARAADAQRLTDMRAALDLQRADEDADRELRKTRDAADYQHQLDQQDIEQGLRIQQIIDNAADERTALQDAFNQQLTDLGLFNIAYHNAQLAQQKQTIEDLKPFMRDWYNSQVEAMAATLQGPRDKWASFGGMQNTLNTLPTAGGATGGSTYNSRAHNGDINFTIQGSGLSESQLESAIYGALHKVFGDAP